MLEDEEPLLLSYVRRTESYFRDCARTDPMFAPEARAATDVLRALESLGVSQAGLKEAQRLIDETEQEEHYNGSAWRDFRMQIQQARVAVGSSAG